MKWLKNLAALLSGSQLPNTDAALDSAIQMMRQGHEVEAVSLMNEAVQQTKELAGEHSIEYAKARFNMGTLKLGLGDTQSAAEHCRAAAECCPDTPQGRKDRLTYLMNTGQILIRCDKADEAVRILETGLRERLALYGQGHAGVAYGQQVLAEALLSVGRFEEGAELAEQAVRIFAGEGHQEYPTTVALYAALLSAGGGDPRTALADFPLERDREWLDMLVHSANQISQVGPDRCGLRFAEQFADWLDQSLPAGDLHRLNAFAAWGNLAAQRGDQVVRCQAANRSVEAAKALGRPDVLINALEGRAFANSANDADAALVRADYEEALRVAEESSLRDEIPGVLRNWAIWEAEQGRDAAAASLYEQAIQKAQSMSDRELLHRVQVAAGIFHQHAGRMEQAATLLAEGIEGLPAMHPDAACGTLHQVALKENIPCPCDAGQTPNPEALSLLAGKFFAESGLEGLIKKVTCEPEGEERGLSVELARTPTEEELQRLQIAHEVFLNILRASPEPTR